MKIKNEVWAFLLGVVVTGAVLVGIWCIGPRRATAELRARAARVERDFERVDQTNRALERQLELAHQAIDRSRESVTWLRATIDGVIDGIAGDTEIVYAIQDGLHAALSIVDNIQAELIGNYRAIGDGE